MVKRVTGPQKHLRGTKSTDLGLETCKIAGYSICPLFVKLSFSLDSALSDSG